MKPLYKIKDFIPDPDTHKDRWEVYDIKEGGMGLVYIVYDHEFREPFAVKTYKDKWLQTEQAKEDFKKEALVWINLDRHENITQAHLVQEINNRIYLFLEYVVGGDLSRYIGTKLLDVKQIIKFALQFCYGMEHAVTHGIVCHRDIKPSNCLITEDRTLKITDFGLAKALDSSLEIQSQVSTTSKIYTDISKTKTGEIGGTPFYMAPEQFKSIKNLDIRSDIYSFGVILYEMISGKLPFFGRTLNELKESHKKKEIPDISPYLDRQEKSLIDILYKCMVKQPENRYMNFTNLVKEFTQIYKLIYNEDPPLPQRGDELSAVELNNKGTSLQKLNLNQEAIKCYNQALEINPKYLKVWSNKGVALEKLKLYQEAIECYNQALKIDPRNSQAWYNKGAALGKLKHYQEAIECCDKALEIDLKYSLAWCSKGTALEELNYDQEAIECYNKALEIDPRNLLSWYNKGIALGNLNCYQEAIACYKQTLEIEPKYSEAWYNKGVTYVKFGYLPQALECFHKAKKLGLPQAEQAIAHCQQLLQQQEKS